MTVELVFLALLAIHVVFSLLVPASPDSLKSVRMRVLQIIAQAPIFWLAVYLGVKEGVFSRDLVSPVYLALGLAIGHVTFAVSLLITHQSLVDTRSHLFDFGEIWNFAVSSPVVLTRFMGGAFAEELIYRAVAQPLLIAWLAHFISPPPGQAVAGIGLTAAAFVLIHRDFFRNTALQGVEFVTFALLLGVLYYWTGSFVLVAVIHTVRNVEIAYLEYLNRAEELGDKNQAAEELERLYGPARPEQS